MPHRFNLFGGTVNKYPIYIPSYSRANSSLTADMLRSEGISYKLVVISEEYETYRAVHGDDCLLVLPFTPDTVVPKRTWIKQYARETGAEFHWQMDDDINQFYRWDGKKRIKCSALEALTVVESFVDRYQNIGAAGIRSQVFPFQRAPFYVNQMVYSVILVKNSIPMIWRGKAGEDTDFSLQIVSSGLCTVLFNLYMFQSPVTSTNRGGNTQSYENDGRYKRAEELRTRWPDLMKIKRRWGRPQFDLGPVWHKFDTPLKPKGEL